MSESSERDVQHWRIGADIDVFDIVSPAEAGTMHCHATYNIGAVLDGHASIDLGYAQHQQPLQSVVMLNPFEPHASAWHAPLNHYFLVSIGAAGWEAITQDLQDGTGGLSLCGPIVEDRILFHAMTGLREQLIREPGSVRIGDVRALLGTVSARRLLQCQAVKTMAATDDLHRLLSLSDDGDDSGNRRIDEIAADLGISRFQFSRLCRLNAGMQPRRLRIQLMVANAQAEIAAGVSLSNAAINAGFSDQSHMNREFRRTIGMTPREFQRVNAALES